MNFVTDTINKSGIRRYLSNNGEAPNIGSEFFDAMDDRVKELVARAQARAAANGRTTVKARDI